MSLFSQVESAYGSAIVRQITATPLVDHRERLVYVTDGVVTKVDTDVERLVLEARVLRALALAGRPVPEVLAVGEPDGQDAESGVPAVLAMSFVAGEPLGTGSPDAAWAAVGAALRRVHESAYDGLGVPVFGGRGSWWDCFRWWPGHECSLPSVRAHLAAGETALLRSYLDDAFAAEPEPPMALLHGDCGPYHWLLDGGRVAAAVDFGDTCLGDPVWDLAVLTLWDGDRLGPVLDGYGPDAAMRERTARLLPPYQVMRHLGALSWLVEHGVDPAPTTRELRRLAVSL